MTKQLIVIFFYQLVCSGGVPFNCMILGFTSLLNTKGLAKMPTNTLISHPTFYPPVYEAM